MIAACQLENAPLPTFNYEYAGLMVVFDAGDISGLDASTEKSSEKSSEKSLLNSTWKAMLAIQENPNVSIAEIAGQIGMTTRAVEKQLKKLKDANFIRRVGSDKSGYWEVLQTVEKK